MWVAFLVTPKREELFSGRKKVNLEIRNDALMVTDSLLLWGSFNQTTIFSFLKTNCNVMENQQWNSFVPGKMKLFTSLLVNAVLNPAAVLFKTFSPFGVFTLKRNPQWADDVKRGSPAPRQTPRVILFIYIYIYLLIIAAHSISRSVNPVSLPYSLCNCNVENRAPKLWFKVS